MSAIGAHQCTERLWLSGGFVYVIGAHQCTEWLWLSGIFLSVIGAHQCTERLCLSGGFVSVIGAYMTAVVGRRLCLGDWYLAHARRQLYSAQACTYAGTKLQMQAVNHSSLTCASNPPSLKRSPHTCACTQTQTHSITHTHAHTRARKCTHLHVHIHTHIYTHIISPLHHCIGRIHTNNKPTTPLDHTHTHTHYKPTTPRIGHLMCVHNWRNLPCTHTHAHTHTYTHVGLASAICMHHI